MIAVWRIASLQLPVFAKTFSLAFRYYEHGRHSQGGRRFKVARQILEHCGLCWIDAVPREEALIDLRKRLGVKIRCGDVEHVLEVAIDFEFLHDCIGMLACAIRKNELAAREIFQCCTQSRIGFQRRMIDAVHELEIIIGLQTMFGHETAHRRSIAFVIFLLQAKSLVFRYLQKIRNISAYAFINLLPQIEVMWVERVVEIEHPGFDMAETARF